MTRIPFVTIVAIMFVSSVLTACATRRAVPPTWDGLELVERPGLDTVYVRPGISLAKYDRVMLDPVEVSFDPNWDPRGSRIGLEAADPQAIREGLARLARDVFRRELQTEGGYELVTEPGDDVLRVRASIVDLYINAPERLTTGIARTYVLDPGRMTLVAELYDSQTNALLARVVDEKRGREYPTFQIANRVTNTAEARRVLAEWAGILRAALDRAREAR